MPVNLKSEVIIENMIAGFIALDSEGMILNTNARARNMLRIPTGQMEGRSVFDAIPDLAGSRGEAVLREAVELRANRKFELFSPSLYNWFEVVAAPAEPAETYVFIRDVTDRERSIHSEAMREALRRILGDAPIAITITTGSDHRIDLMNNAAQALVGGRNLEGLTMKAALPDLNDQFFEIIDTVFETGEPKTLSNLQVTYDREGTGELYTGQFDVTYQPMFDAAGTVTGIVSTSVEKTQNLAAEGR